MRSRYNVALWILNVHLYTEMHLLANNFSFSERHRLCRLYAGFRIAALARTMAGEGICAKHAAPKPGDEIGFIMLTSKLI